MATSSTHIAHARAHRSIKLRNQLALYNIWISRMRAIGFEPPPHLLEKKKAAVQELEDLFLGDL